MKPGSRPETRILPKASGMGNINRHMTTRSFIFFPLFCILALASCSAMDRSADAGIARGKMVGMPKEEVLACMGMPQRRGTVGATEVWSYHSSSGEYASTGLKDKVGSNLTFSSTQGEHLSCTVNVVMVNNAVKAVRYYGPRGGLFTPDEQCGFAIEHCVRGD